MSPVETTPELVVRDAKAWRAWLAKHHADSSGVLVVLAKSSDNPFMADQDLPPERLGAVFANFVRQIVSGASRESPLLDKIVEHLGTDPA